MRDLIEHLLVGDEHLELCLGPIEAVERNFMKQRVAGKSEAANAIEAILRSISCAK